MPTAHKFPLSCTPVFRHTFRPREQFHISAFPVPQWHEEFHNAAKDSHSANVEKFASNALRAIRQTSSRKWCLTFSLLPLLLVSESKYTCCLCSSSLLIFLLTHDCKSFFVRKVTFQLLIFGALLVECYTDSTPGIYSNLHWVACAILKLVPVILKRWPYVFWEGNCLERKPWVMWKKGKGGFSFLFTFWGSQEKGSRDVNHVLAIQWGKGFG